MEHSLEYLSFPKQKIKQVLCFINLKILSKKIQVALLAQTRIFDIKRRLDYFPSVDNQRLKAIKEKYKKFIVR